MLAIPHNGNLSNGLMFSVETNDGKPLTKELAALRAALEPLVEVTQIKGDGESHACQVRSYAVTILQLRNSVPGTDAPMKLRTEEIIGNTG